MASGCSLTAPASSATLEVVAVPVTTVVVVVDFDAVATFTAVPAATRGAVSDHSAQALWTTGVGCLRSVSASFGASVGWTVQALLLGDGAIVADFAAVSALAITARKQSALAGAYDAAAGWQAAGRALRGLQADLAHTPGLAVGASALRRITIAFGSTGNVSAAVAALRGCAPAYATTSALSALPAALRAAVADYTSAFAFMAVADVSGGASLLLDSHSGAVRAYSLQLLLSTYTGPVIQAWKSGPLTQDFYADEIYDGTLASWLSGADGFVRIWYDQTETADAYEVTSSNMPQIASAGTVDTNGIYFTGSRNLDDAGGGATPAALSVYSVQKKDSTGSFNNGIYKWGQRAAIFAQNTYWRSEVGHLVNAPVDSWGVLAYRYQEGQQSAHFNDANEFTAAATGKSSETTLYVGRANFDATSLGGYMKELVIFNSYKNDTDDSAISTEIMGRYSLT